MNLKLSTRIEWNPKITEIIITIIKFLASKAKSMFMISYKGENSYSFKIT